MPKRFTTKMTRAVALKKLSALLDRVSKWNIDFARYFAIDKVVLVGSLARNETSVRDIDLCFRLSRNDCASRLDEKNEYIEWRELELGLKPPRDLRGELNMYELDPLKYIKARDGRIELLRWDQLDFISLTLNPIVTLVEDGKLKFDNPVEAIANAKSISMQQAENIINTGEIRHFSNVNDDEYWKSYCRSLNKFPELVRDMILARDGTAERYFNSVFYSRCLVANRPD
jgi:predicted nucleotidyltransferase